MTTALAPGRGSVRLRTTAAATVVVLLTLCAAAWVLLTTLQSALGRSQDEAARARADALVGLAAAGRLPGTLPSVGDDGFVQVVDGSGRVVGSSANVAGRPAAFTFQPQGGEQEARTVRGVRDDRDLEDYRVWAERGASSTGPVTVYVATSLEVGSEAVSTLRDLLVVGAPIVAAVLAGLTWLVVGQALRPVEAIRAEVAGISDADQGRRVPEPQGDDEIARLARTMNQMLARLQEASRRQGAFTADASHELQSPLTSLRTQVEVALARPDETDWPRVGRAVLAETEGMEAMVRDLLYLAREDEPAPPALLVDLDDVVLEEAARARSASGVELSTGAVSAAPVRGSREQLVRLTRNLLENATRHATGRVDVSLGVADGHVRLVVRDDGPGVPAAGRSRIFDRFVRLDDARSRHVRGAGLGLSIVAAIAQRHGGSVHLVDTERPVGAHGATFVVQLPVADEDAGLG